MYENQRLDFNLWGRVYRKETHDGGPRLQRNPLARMIEIYGKRSAEPVTYEQLDPNELTRDDIRAAHQAVEFFMGWLKVEDSESHICLMARHAWTLTDRRGVTWVGDKLPERMAAKAIFGGDAEAAKSQFRRACERGYVEYERMVLQSEPESV